MHDTWLEGFNLPVNKPSNKNLHMQSQGTQGTLDLKGMSMTSVEHKQDGQDNRNTETKQMDTSESPEGNEDTNNMSPLKGVTNPPQVLDKHGSAATDVEESEPSKPSPADRYDWVETKSSPTDDEHQSMTPSESPKRSQKLRTERDSCHHTARGHAAKHGTLHHRDHNHARAAPIYIYI